MTSINNDTVRSIYVLDETGLLSETFKTSDQTIYTQLSEIDLETAKTLSNQEQAYGLLHIPDSSLEFVSELIKFYSEESPSLSLMSSLESKISDLGFQIVKNINVPSSTYRLNDGSVHVYAMKL